MIIRRTMKIFSTASMVILLLFISNITFSQNLKWNNTPYKGFVFQITNKEAQKLLTLTSTDSIVTRMLHTQIDTFDTRVGWINRPSKGHFILVNIVSNSLACEYASVFPYQVFLLKEYDALTLQVLDMDGYVRNDAKVKFKLKKIPFDENTKTYRLDNKWFYGNKKVVTVELDGFRSIFNIERNEAPTWSGNSYRGSGPDFYSYMITDKNKYKPHEKVRFKSFALSGSRSPMHRDLTLWLSYRTADYRYTEKKISVVTPHRPGSYVGEFQLHDSLKMTLDQNYELELKDRFGRIVSRCNFRYEDYELNGNNLEVHLSAQEHYHPSGNQLSITATDANGLMMKDARATVVVRTRDINETFQQVAVLKDTLMLKEINLEPNAPTTLDIPSDIFQKTNTYYDVYVTVLNAENQRLEKVASAKHLYSQYELRARLSADSIIYEMLNNGTQAQNVPGKIKYNGEEKSRNVLFPFKEKLNPAIRTVYLSTENISNTISMDRLAHRLEITGGIKNDSLRLSLRNPHKFETSWYIYKGGDLVTRGSGTEMSFDSLVTDHSQTYYVELLYTFGGAEQVKRRSFEFREKQLDIELQIPDRTFPGQTVDALIQVNNQSGDPVNNVDLTAFAVTSKLRYNVPDLPFYGDVSESRPQRDTYDKRDLNKRSAKLKLNYNKWVMKAGLDTMIYYQFTYPHSGMFKHSIPISDSTQFAPYVMKDGEAQKVYVIEVNRQPVYYSWVNEPNRYSFYAPTKSKVQITVRLFDRVLIFDSLKFEPGKKTIFSVDLDHLPANIKVLKIQPRKDPKRKISYPSFTPTEIRRHTDYISIFNQSVGRSYLEAGKVFVPLYYGTNNKKFMVVGPVLRGKQTYHDLWHDLKTTYQHAGGFTYSFEDNIVYKQDAKDLLPEVLHRGTYEVLTNINDLVMTKKEFLSIVVADSRWYTRVIDVSDKAIRMKVFLPEEKAKSGFKSFLFENASTKDVNSPCQLRWKESNYSGLPRGLYNIIALYNNGTYVKKDSIDFQSFTKVAVDLSDVELHAADDLSQRWMRTSVGECFPETKVAAPVYQPIRYNRLPSVGNIRGIVFDSEGHPLPGCNVVQRGTTNGTATDIDGVFTLDVDEYDVTLVFSFIGFSTQELQVQYGSEVMVTMEEDVKQLQEVVVVGYSTEVRQEMTGALMGRVAGVSISMRDEIESPVADKTNQETKEAEDQLYNDLLNLKTIRSNFSDVGFWEPKLFTDRKGQAKFTITYPDDITQWNATVYGMNRYLQTGTARKKIKSYKPIMAQLAVPNFLTVGDSVVFTGKVLNYTDSKNITGKLKWSRAGVDSEKPVSFSEFNIDRYALKVAATDSVKTSFVFTRDDGYMDGEERKVPVVEQGIVRGDGTLAILSNAGSKTIRAGGTESISVEVLANPLDIYEFELEYLKSYRYACNEQLASKLLGLLNYKRWMKFQRKEVGLDKDINRIIGKLLKNQNEQFLWSWWDIDEKTSYWMSAHILRALKTAADEGYVVNLDVENLGRKSEYKFDVKREYSLREIDLLNALAQWKVNLDYKMHIARLDSMIWREEKYERRHNAISSHMTQRLQLQEIRQLRNVAFNIDSVFTYRRDGILGDLHFSDDTRATYWYYDDLIGNTVAYRILKRDSASTKLTEQMQLYFINARHDRGWNTFESSTILSTVLPDLLAKGVTRDAGSAVRLNGKVNKSVKEFPYKVSLDPGEELTVTNQSGFPIYLMSYKTERVIKATTGVGGFEIKTSLSNNTGILEAGKPVVLKVEVNVKKDADLEYVMIEIPVPGSCSYGDKIQTGNNVETHREYFKDRAVIFCENMRSGRYTFDVNLLPRFTGKFFVNPSQVSLMYVPVVNANTDMKSVLVR